MVEKRYVTFHNVTITVELLSDGHVTCAYDSLCDALGGANFDYITDTYSVDDDGMEHSTSDLFPSV